jgi:CheY-like chemotaxis protein
MQNQQEAATILVIDDIESILKITRHFLEKEGYNVETAITPYEGIRIAQEKKIDLIILDIMMPGLSGYEVFNILKKDPKTRDIPVIMLTAKAVIMNTPKTFFYGLYGFLAKPFTKSSLINIVKDTLALTQVKEPSPQPKIFSPEPESETQTVEEKEGSEKDKA